MKPTRNPFLLVVSFSVSTLFMSPIAGAVNFVWNGNVANWNTGSEWTAPGPPSGGGGNFAIINSGTANITQDQASIQDILMNNTGITNGSGIVNQSAGAIATTGWVRMGLGTGGLATYNLSGGTLTTNRLIVTETSSAKFVMTGGTLQVNGEIWAGGSITNPAQSNTGQTGEISMSDGTMNSTSWLAIGRDSIGILNLSGGVLNAATAGTNNSSNITIGSFAAGAGTINVSGTGALNTPNSIYVGENGNGTLNVSGSAVVTTTGAASALNIAKAAGTGTVNLNGGRITTRTVIKGGAGTATFNFNGGTLQANATGLTLMGGLTRANVRDGGAKIDTQANNVSITQALLHSDNGADALIDGGLVKSGSGMLTLSGANTYTGNTTINGGIVHFRNTAALPGYTNPGGSGSQATVASGAGIALGVGGPSSFSAADITAIRNNTSGKFTFSGDYTLGIDTTDATTANGNPGDSFTYSESITNSGPSVVGLMKIGTNTLALGNANSYTGITEIRGGTLSVASLADGGTASGIGASAAAPSNLLMNGGGSLAYTGAAVTTDRGFTLGAGGGGVNNSGDLTFSGQILAGGNGAFTKNGTGTLSFTNTNGTNTLAAGNSGSFGFVVNHGKVLIGGTAGSPLVQTNVINGELIIATSNTTTSPDVAMEINGGTTTVTSYIGVGRGNGTNNAKTSLTLNNNAEVTSGNFAIGYSNNVLNYTSSPTVNFNGTSKYTDTGVFTLGESANGLGGVTTINVNDNASVILTTINATGINVGAAGAAIMNQNGGSVSALVAVNIARDLASVASYNLNGGTLSAPSVKKGAGTGTFNFNSGTLKATGANPAFVTGVTTLVKSGGAVIDSNGFAVVVDTSLNNDGVAVIDGGLTKKGDGTLTLNQTNNYNGATQINGGTLALSATGSIDSTSGVSLGTVGTLDVAAKGGYTINNLSGSGNVIGALTISNSLAIGNSPGTINFDSSLTLAADSTFNYEVDSTLNLADLANVAGDLNLNSAALVLSNLGTYELDDKFTLFSYFGNLTGEFDALADDSIFSASGGLWQINYDDTEAGLNSGTHSKFVTVTAVPEPSAAALLGIVGAAALLRRRQG